MLKSLYFSLHIRHFLFNMWTFHSKLPASILLLSFVSLIVTDVNASDRVVLRSAADTIKPPPVAAQFVNEIHDAGYPAEIHKVLTVDDYIVRMLRIPYSPISKNQPRKPVFLMHPFLESSHAWIVQGPGKALAYLLADAGYDVWMGNARGTNMSRDHGYLNASSPSYWEYSWQDIGQKDLPAFIDYVLKETKAPKLNYVGFSQGTTVFLVLTSTRPEYNDKIDHASLMAPVAFLKNTGSMFYKTMSKFYPQLKAMCKKMGYHKITADSLRLLEKAEYFCKSAYPKKSTGCNYFTWFIGFDRVRPELMKPILEHVPAGVSLRQILHFAQLIRSSKFQQFDYDDEFLNWIHYGQTKPPAFDLDRVTVDINMYLSTDDTTTTIGNIMELRDRLPHVKQTYIFSNFTHSDFVYHEQAVHLVYDKVISDMVFLDKEKTTQKNTFH